MTATPPQNVAAIAEAIGFDGKPRKPHRNSRSERSATRQRAAERRVRVSASLIAKRTYREIAAQEGVSLACIVDDVRVIRAGWAERASQLYGTVVSEEIAKLDAMERGIAARAMLGEENAIVLMLRIADRRAKLMGLDQPTQVRAQVLTAYVGPTAAEALAQLEGADRDDRAIGITAVLIEAGAIADPSAIAVESRERARDDEGEAGGADHAEADEVHPADPDDQAGRLPAA